MFRIPPCCLTAYEVRGWSSSARDWGIIAGRDGEHLVLAEISPQYVEELAGLAFPSVMELNRALLRNSSRIIAEIELRYRAGEFVEKLRDGDVCRVVRVTGLAN